MLITSTRLVAFIPARLADMTGDPIALYVVFSDTIWLILIGKNTLSAYKENKTPIWLLVIFSNVLEGIVMVLMVYLSGSLYSPLETFNVDSERENENEIQWKHRYLMYSRQTWDKSEERASNIHGNHNWMPIHTSDRLHVSCVCWGGNWHISRHCGLVDTVHGDWFLPLILILFSSRSVSIWSIFITSSVINPFQLRYIVFGIANPKIPDYSVPFVEEAKTTVLHANTVLLDTYHAEGAEGVLRHQQLNLQD